MEEKEIARKVKLIHEELAFIGRYMDSISPNLSKYAELARRKEILRQQLKMYPRKEHAPKKNAKERRSMFGVNTVANRIYQHYYKEPPSQSKLPKRPSN